MLFLRDSVLNRVTVVMIWLVIRLQHSTVSGISAPICRMSSFFFQLDNSKQISAPLPSVITSFIRAIGSFTQTPGRIICELTNTTYMGINYPFPKQVLSYFYRPHSKEMGESTVFTGVCLSTFLGAGYPHLAYIPPSFLMRGTPIPGQVLGPWGTPNWNSTAWLSQEVSNIDYLSVERCRQLSQLDVTDQPMKYLNLFGCSEIHRVQVESEHLIGINLGHCPKVRLFTELAMRRMVSLLRSRRRTFLLESVFSDITSTVE